MLSTTCPCGSAPPERGAESHTKMLWSSIWRQRCVQGARQGFSSYPPIGTKRFAGLPPPWACSVEPAAELCDDLEIAIWERDHQLISILARSVLRVTLTVTLRHSGTCDTIMDMMRNQVLVVPMDPWTIPVSTDYTHTEKQIPTLGWAPPSVGGCRP